MSASSIVRPYLNGSATVLTDLYVGNGGNAVSVVAGSLYFTDGNSLDAGAGTNGLVISSAPAHKIGFYGKTPGVVQATTAGGAGTFAAVTGTAVLANSTFNGYTIGQVVVALQALGLLA